MEAAAACADVGGIIHPAHQIAEAFAEIVGREPCWLECQVEQGAASQQVRALVQQSSAVPHALMQRRARERGDDGDMDVIALHLCGCGTDQDAEFIIPEVVDETVDATWVDIFFESIRAKNRNVGIDDLESRVIDDGEFEVRVYAGFGLQGFRIGGHPLDLVVITFSPEGVRTARYAASPDGPIVREHPDPAFWNALYRNGLFDLPDSNTIDGYNRGVLDGVSYVVELKSADAYRHYRYSNPAHSPNVPEAQSMLAIIDLLKEHTTFDAGFQ